MRHYILMGVFLCVAFLAGCGSASAPPIDLPAPVVGRVTVGAPDASRKSTITGTEGAVPGGSIVMAINERIAGTASLMWKISDALIPVAYAQSLPAVCSQSGHACIVANADGSFVMTIDAAIGDNIIIVLIDELGTEISERLSIIVPELTAGGDVPVIKNCAGTGATGTVVDMFNASGTPILLRQGDETTTNRLIIGERTVALPGCFAKNLSFFDLSLGIARIVVTSSDEPLVWTTVGAWESLTADSPGTTTYTLESAPLALASTRDPNRVAIALQGASGLQIGILSLDSGVVGPTLPVTPPGVVEGVTALRTIGPFAGDIDTMGALLFVTTELGMRFDRIVLFYLDGTNLSNVTFDAYNSIGMSGREIRDIQFSGSLEPEQKIHLLMTDHLNSRLLIGRLYDSTTTEYPKLGTALVGVSPRFNFDSFDEYFNTPNVQPIHLALTTIASVPYVFMTTDDGSVWTEENFVVAPISRLFSPPDIPDVVTPAGIAWSEGSLFVADDGSKTFVDVSAALPVP